MHILIISDYETRGGAAIATSRLATAFCRAGHRVSRVVAFPDRKLHPWRTIVLAPPLFLLRRALRSRLKPALQERLDQLPACGAVEQLTRLIKRLKPDLINVNNLHGGTGAGWSAELLRPCVAAAPTLWTFYDMWPITARCTYSGACRRFISGCTAACPTANEFPALAPERVQPAWERRRRLLAELPALVGVAPSRWMAGEARAGLWQGRQVVVIPSGLPLGTFRPHEHELARRVLGLPATGPLLLVAAADLSEQRKGGALLATALTSLNEPLTLLALGAGKLPNPPPHVRIIPLGQINDPRRLALAYSAADALVHPAPLDNLPNVVAEALACGTPAIALPGGGLPEMVHPGLTGWLADNIDAESLTLALHHALEDRRRGTDLRNACRAFAEQEYDDALMVERYLEVGGI